jgi:hypothetical protein
MAGKVYKLCARDTAADLAAQVSEHLAHGWELYGHPFIGAESLYCQAVISSGRRGWLGRWQSRFSKRDRSVTGRASTDPEAAYEASSALRRGIH